VRVLRPDVNRSRAQADLEPDPEGGAGGRDACLEFLQPTPGPFVRGTPDPTPEHRRDGAFAVRMGLDAVQGIGLDAAHRVVQARDEGPFTSIPDLVRRTGLTTAQVESLATAGAFDSLGLSRREALWNAGYTDSPDMLPGTATVVEAPMLPGMTPAELTVADLWATHVSPDTHPLAYVRGLLDAEGVLAVASLAGHEPRRRVHVGGLITHRQRPATASGVTFLNLEDETGMLNVVVTPDVWKRHQRVARGAAAVVVRGMLEVSEEGVVNLVAEKLVRLEELYPAAAAALPARHRARDFR